MSANLSPSTVLLSTVILVCLCRCRSVSLSRAFNGIISGTPHRLSVCLSLNFSVSLCLSISHSLALVNLSVYHSHSHAFNGVIPAMPHRLYVCVSLPVFLCLSFFVCLPVRKSHAFIVVIPATPQRVSVCQSVFVFLLLCISLTHFQQFFQPCLIVSVSVCFFSQSAFVNLSVFIFHSHQSHAFNAYYSSHALKSVCLPFSDSHVLNVIIQTTPPRISARDTFVLNEVFRAHATHCRNALPSYIIHS